MAENPKKPTATRRRTRYRTRTRTARPLSSYIRRTRGHQRNILVEPLIHRLLLNNLLEGIWIMAAGAGAETLVAVVTAETITNPSHRDVSVTLQSQSRMLFFGGGRRLVTGRALVGRAFSIVAHGTYSHRGYRCTTLRSAVSYTHLRAHETDSYLVCR